jgi:hypothetical protein
MTAPAAGTNAPITPLTPGQSYPFQPNLDPNRRPMRQAGPTWSEHGGGDLTQFAQAIILPENVVTANKVERLSLPSPWARLLLFEHAILYGTRHPARPQIVDEWRGLLGILALAEMLSPRQPKLSTKVVSLDGALAEMLPGSWPAAANREVNLIFWDGHLIGGAAPITLVFTGRRALNSNQIPFVDKDTGRLTDPVAYYANALDSPSAAIARGALGVLSAWMQRTLRIIDERREELDEQLGVLAGEGGELTRRRKIVDELRSWKLECDAALTAAEADDNAIAELELDSDTELFGSPLDFLRPVRWEEKTGIHPFALAHAPHVVVNPEKGKVLDKSGNPFNGQLPVRGAVMLEVSHGVVATKIQPTLIESEKLLSIGNLFTPKLIRMLATDTDINLDFVQPLVVGTSRYFLPFDPEVAALVLDEAILGNFSAEDRRDRGTIAVIVDLKVQGGRFVRFEREYSKTSAIEEPELSDLSIWPNFESQAWQSYYWSNMIAPQAASNVVRFSPVEPPESVKQAPFGPSGTNGTRWGVSDRALRFWAVTCSQSDAKGLLMLKRPADPTPTNEELAGKRWSVAVDFGSTHTLAYVRTQSSHESVELPFSDRTVKLIGSGKDVEYSFFAFRLEPGSPVGAPTLLWAPADKLYDPKNAKDRRWIPGYGHVFYGTEVKNRRWSSLFADLKWRPMALGEERVQAELAFRNYLSHFALMISAEAAAHDAEIERVYGSYPGVFSYPQQQAFEATLQEAVDFAVPIRNDAAPSIVPADEDEFSERKATAPRRIRVELPCDEATALESYLAAYRDVNNTTLTGLFAVDIGGSTSDFVVLRAEEGSVRHYASVQFAGSVVNRVMASSERTVAAVSAALRSSFIGLSDRDATRIMRLLEAPEKRSVGAGLLIRTLAADPATMPKFAKALFNCGVDGQRILAAIAYLFATNAFYMGLLAHPMEEDREGEGYPLYFAGRGSQLLDWISALRPARADTPTAGEDLIAHFFLAGLNVDVNLPSGLSPELIRVLPPKAHHAKREVALGLLHLNDTLRDLQGDERSHDNLIAEFGLTREDGTPISWNDPLTVELLSSIKAPRLGFKPRNLGVFSAFVSSFSTLNLKIQGFDLTKLLKLTPKSLEDPLLTDRVRARLFGEGSAYSKARAGKSEGESATIEPLFIGAAKAMLEYGLEVPRLF